MRGSVRGGDNSDTGHGRNGAYSSEHVFLKPGRKRGELIDQVKVPDFGMFGHSAPSFQSNAAPCVHPTSKLVFWSGTSPHASSSSS